MLATETIILVQGSIGKIELETAGKTATFRPVGVVDEQIDLSHVLKAIERLGTGYEFRFDLGSIVRINSPGVEGWIKLMDRLPPEPRYVFLNVCEIMVEQANMLPRVFGKTGALIRNFQAPYLCGKCDKPVAILLEPAQVTYSNGSPTAPEISCPICTANLTFDWHAEEYFAFLKRI